MWAMTVRLMLEADTSLQQMDGDLRPTPANRVQKVSVRFSVFLLTTVPSEIRFSLGLLGAYIVAITTPRDD